MDRLQMKLSQMLELYDDVEVLQALRNLASLKFIMADGPTDAARWKKLGRAMTAAVRTFNELQVAEQEAQT